MARAGEFLPLCSEDWVGAVAGFVCVELGLVATDACGFVWVYEAVLSC